MSEIIVSTGMPRPTISATASRTTRMIERHEGDAVRALRMMAQAARECLRVEAFDEVATALDVEGDELARPMPRYVRRACAGSGWCPAGSRNASRIGFGRSAS